MEGFPVVAAPWRKPEVALAQLEMIRSVRKNSTRATVPSLSEAVARRGTLAGASTYALFVGLVRAMEGTGSTKV